MIRLRQTWSTQHRIALAAAGSTRRQGILLQAPNSGILSFDRWRMCTRGSMKDKPERFLIVGAGVSGSTLLAATMAGAGANFRAEKVAEWDRRSGAYADMTKR
jgi:hypothetical protein